MSIDVGYLQSVRLSQSSSNPALLQVTGKRLSHSFLFHTMNILNAYQFGFRQHVTVLL